MARSSDPGSAWWKRSRLPVDHHIGDAEGGAAQHRQSGRQVLTRTRWNVSKTEAEIPTSAPASNVGRSPGVNTHWWRMEGDDNSGASTSRSPSPTRCSCHSPCRAATSGEEKASTTAAIPLAACRVAAITKRTGPLSRPVVADGTGGTPTGSMPIGTTATGSGSSGRVSSKSATKAR